MNIGRLYVDRITDNVSIFASFLQRMAEEDRYRTEQVKLQLRQLDLELFEKRRGSPPAGKSLIFAPHFFLLKDELDH